MKLEKIKLSGFKSFVDPTTIPIKGNLVSVVGPNGCGKSNIIDAIRWAMGESSVKRLRGGNMADVIFNGSAGRRPVSTATVELVFDNFAGRTGGEFANYNTLAIKRQISRDGQSVYLLNGTKCRRKDITDLFLSAGLGARSYAIIEQGTIAQIVEAKPDELRIHIEVAAGIAKYKERRNETQMRIRHSRENLQRLDDVRETVEKQLKHLHQQAQKAQKYTALKIQERQLRLELLAMRWRTYQQTGIQLEAKLQDTSGTHNQLFMQRKELEQKLEQQRLTHKTQQQDVNKRQDEYYQLLTQLSRLEQIIKHNKQTREETELELTRLHEQTEHLQGNLDKDLRQLGTVRETLLQATESLSLAQKKQHELLQKQQAAKEQSLAWQQEWEAYKNQSAHYREQAEVKCMQIAQLENQNAQMQSRLQRLQDEHDKLKTTGLEEEMTKLEQSIRLIEEQRAALQIELDSAHLSISNLRQQIKQYHHALHNDRSELQTIKGKVSSLEMLQQHAVGKNKQHLTHWLERMELIDNQRLAECMTVQCGWDSAVETVLGSYLEAVCIDNTDQLMNELASLSDESIILFETQQRLAKLPANNLVRLMDKIKTPWNLQGLLSGIYCADSLEQAQQIVKKLKPYESVITIQGTWMGYGWVKVTHDYDAKSGVLQREKELRLSKEEQIKLQAGVVIAEKQLATAEAHLKESENQREDWQQKYKVVSHELSLKNIELSTHSAHMEQRQQRLIQVINEMADINRELLDNATTCEQAVMIKGQAEVATQALESVKLQLEKNSDSLQTQSEQSDKQVNESRQQVHALQISIANLKSTDALTAKQIEHLQQQNQQTQKRIAELDKKLPSTLEPIDDERDQLENLQQDKNKLALKLKQVRQQHEVLESEITKFTKQYAAVQQQLAQQKDLLDTIRFEQQESHVRQQAVTEQLDELEADAGKILQTLAIDADESSWKIQVESLTQQIDQLGAINLTAISEYKAQSERMNFLNEQNADLLEALQTLEQAIIKIDAESRQRFKQTFDKINTGLLVKFPKLFGGGKAYLSLTDNNLLESGVNIIAQPPGKRNSSIHSLSGGEKALTAVALIFSIFALNPAPFCLLDEVDAPLDEANVRRFSAMVKEMSASVQFLYVSHNKVTMEIAQQLVGVTMKESGVSRMVAVDIQEAVAMAEN